MNKKETKERAVELIREGKSYAQTADTIKQEGGKIAGATYYRHKQEIFPSEKMDAALEKTGERREEREVEKKKVQRRAKWSTQKQKAADESPLAKLINKGVFHATLPFCKTRALKEEDVQDINVGGAAVANILYFFPDVNLDHPAIVLTTRIILFYIKFKAICSAVKQKMDELKAKVVGGNSGIKEEWQQK